MLSAAYKCLTMKKLVLVQKLTTKRSIIQHLRLYSKQLDNIELPPEPKSCCLAGCTNCVWVEYAYKISKLLDGNDDKAREIILNKVSDPVLKSFLSIELRTIQKQGGDSKNNE